MADSKALADGKALRMNVNPELRAAAPAGLGGDLSALLPVSHP
jgi:hypothetical protein